jgi:16S rRNA (cytosine967-C5)-methyltransferase
LPGKIPWYDTPVISPARLAAFEILQLVETGSYASELLLRRTADLDKRDAGLASEIVFGSLRYQAQLDFLISQHTRKKLDLAVGVALRMGIYQLRHLDRVPSHAIVTESVELVKRAKKRSAAGFVNAILRKINRDPVPWPDRATSLSMPAWLLARWDRQFGEDKASRIARTFLKPPETYVRNPPAREDLIVEATDVPGCFRVIAGEIKDLRIQDIGSQSIVPLLDLQEGQTFLDLCSAPGNKTAQALEYRVRAVACDRNLHRLENVSCAERVVLDAGRPLPFRRSFDRILLDAPCSGTGTLARNPEIRWRVRESDLDDLQERQTRMLKVAVESLAPGGRLVYSTCSLEPEENENVVAQFHPALTLRRTPGLEPGDGFFAAVIISE